VDSNLVSLSNFAKQGKTVAKVEKSRSPPVWKQRLEQKRKERKESN